MLKTIKIAPNKSGKRHALTTDGATFGVYAECSNYDRGSMIKTWRYVQKGMDLAAAESLFARRLAGVRK